MPEQYEAIKRSLKKRNPKMKAAAVKTHAAKIFNAGRKPGQKPVTRKSK